MADTRRWASANSHPVAAAAFVIASVLFGVSGHARAASPVQFSLEVTPSTGTVSDSFTATVHIELPGVAGPDRYVQPDFWDFSVVDTVTRKSMSSTTDGSGKQHLRFVEVHSYVLHPKTAGHLRVGPASLRIGNKEFETKPAYVRVMAAGAAAPESPQKDAALSSSPDPTAAGVGAPGYLPPLPTRTDDVFVHAVTSAGPHVAGGQLIATWLLFTRVDILQVGFHPPVVVGAGVRSLYDPASRLEYFEVMVGRVPYRVAVVAKLAIFPRSPGPMEIPPLVAEVITSGVSLDRPRVIASDASTLSIESLPSPAPAGFDPAYVGVVEAAASIDRSALRADESLTLTLTVRMQGDIGRTTVPAVALPGFRVRAPIDYRESTVVDGDVVAGTRIYEYWMTPLDEHVTEVPAIELSYFDPATQRYQIAATAPLGLQVGPAAVVAVAQRDPMAVDLAPLRTGAEIVSRRQSRLDQRGWYWRAVVGMPVLTFGFALGLVAFRRRERGSPELRRRRIRRARDRGFAALGHEHRGDEAPAFYRSLTMLVTTSLDSLLGAATAALTRDALHGLLLARGVDAGSSSELIAYLDHCDACRFAPGQSSRAQCIADAAKGETLLRRVESALRQAGEPDRREEGGR